MVTTREGSQRDDLKISERELRKLRLEVEEELVEFKMSMNNLRKFDADNNRRLRQSDFDELGRLNDKIYKKKRDLDRSDAMSIKRLRMKVADLVKDAENSDLMVYINVQDVLNNYRLLLNSQHYSKDIKKKASRELNKVLSATGSAGNFNIYDMDRSNQSLNAAIKKLDDQAKKIAINDLKKKSDLSLYSHRERTDLDNRKVGNEKFKDAFLKNPGRFNPDDLLKDIYGLGLGSVGLHGLDDILGLSDRLSGVSKVGFNKLRGRYSKKDYLNKFAGVDKTDKLDEENAENIEEVKDGIDELVETNKKVLDQLKESEMTQSKMINNQMTQIKLSEKSISEINEAISRDNTNDSIREKKASKGLLSMLAGVASGGGFDWKDALGIGGGAATGGGILGWLKGKGGSIKNIFKGSGSTLLKGAGKGLLLGIAEQAGEAGIEYGVNKMNEAIFGKEKAAEYKKFGDAMRDRSIFQQVTDVYNSWADVFSGRAFEDKNEDPQVKRQREKDREDLAKKIAKELNPKLNFDAGLPNYPGAGVSEGSLDLSGSGGSSGGGSSGGVAGAGRWGSRGGSSGGKSGSSTPSVSPEQARARQQAERMFSPAFMGDGSGAFSAANGVQSSGFTGSGGGNYKLSKASSQSLTQSGIGGKGAGTNVQSWYQFLTKPVAQGGLGRTPEQARGEIASMRGESGSGMNSAAYNPNDVDGESGGTAQWHDSSRNGSTRFSDLKKFAAAQGKDWTDVGVQQQYYRHEMLGSEAKANARILSANTAQEAMDAHIKGFERPADPEGESAKRSQYLTDTRATDSNTLLSKNSALMNPDGAGLSTKLPSFAGQGTGGVDKIVTENQGQVAGIRKQGIEPDLKRNIAKSVYRTLGPGYKVEVYSGGQNGKDEGGPRTGSTRHDHGGAADLRITGPDGKQISQEDYARVSQGYIASGYGGVGMQMSGGGIHMDKHTDRAKYWNYNNEGGPIVSKESQRLIDQGLAGVNPEYKFTDAEADNYLNGTNGTNGTDPRRVRTTVVPQMDMPSPNKLQPPATSDNVSQAPAGSIPAGLNTAMNASTAKDTKNSIDDLGISMFQQMLLG